MDAIMGLLGFFNHLVDAVEFLFFGIIAAIVGVSFMPKDNPLYQLLVSLTKHLAATFAIAIVGLPVQPIPGIDLAYDTGSILFLAYYWGSFAWELLSDSSPLRHRTPVIDAKTPADASYDSRQERPFGDSPAPAGEATVIDAEPSARPAFAPGSAFRDFLKRR